jgi:hypothetical protein
MFGLAAAVGLLLLVIFVIRRRRIAVGAALNVVGTSRHAGYATYDVFVSHSTKDRDTAMAVCKGLEVRGLRCWIAPRDVRPGASYDEAIVDAIHSSGALVLVLTSNSNASQEVAREVRIAIDAGSTVIPFRVEDVPLSGALRYHLVRAQWLDALTRPLDGHLDALAAAIAKWSANGSGEEAKASGSSAV